MDTILSNWNGYAVHGNVKELDFIADSVGFINLDEDDIISVLSSEGENWIAAGVGSDIDKALSEAITNLPCKINNICNLLIEFICGIRQPKMKELSVVQAALTDVNPDVKITWGLTSDESLGETCKAILVASAKS